MCIDKLTDGSRFAPIEEKLAGGVGSRAPRAVPVDTTYPAEKEQRLIAEWAAARGECIRAANRFGTATYRPPIQAIGIEAETRVLAAALVLYNGKMSYGEFNQERQAIANEMRARLAALSRQIQSQRATQVQADREARERAEMQKQIDEAERQTLAARQQAAKAREAQERTARSSAAARAQRPSRPRQPPAAPVRYPDCFAFGDRMVCTNR